MKVVSEDESDGNDHGGDDDDGGRGDDDNSTEHQPRRPPTSQEVSLLAGDFGRAGSEWEPSEAGSKMNGPQVFRSKLVGMLDVPPSPTSLSLIVTSTRWG